MRAEQNTQGAWLTSEYPLMKKVATRPHLPQRANGESLKAASAQGLTHTASSNAVVGTGTNMGSAQGVGLHDSRACVELTAGWGGGRGVGLRGRQLGASRRVRLRAEKSDIPRD